MLEALSSLARTGWMLRGIPSCLAESVAEHSFWASVLAFEIAVRLRTKGRDVDPYRAAAIALFHDIGESVIGDIARVAGISREEKLKAERMAVQSLPLTDEAKKLQEEFDRGETDEALVARLSESLATLIKAIVYGYKGYNVNDIKENMEKIIKEITDKLGARDIVYDMLRDMDA